MAPSTTHLVSIDAGAFPEAPSILASLSFSALAQSAVWWALPIVVSILRRMYAWDSDLFTIFESFAVKSSILETQIAQLEILLAFLWAATAAYLAHLFASSLMSRWLIHYSPAAVLVRLASLSVILSFACNSVFAMAGASYYSGGHLDRALLLWIAMSIAVLGLYFRTQHDISVDEDKDDRKRRLVLRSKSVNAIALASTVSLCALLLVVHVSGAGAVHSANA